MAVECAKTTKENPANFISNDFLGDYSIVCSAVDIASETYNKQEDDQKLQIVHSTTAKTKLTKLAPKTIGLKRVSFGSSKNSMVETLFFETSTPVSEEIESCNPLDNFHSEIQSACSKNIPEDKRLTSNERLDDSALQVCIYQSIEPQQICVTDFLSEFDDDLRLSLDCSYNIIDTMATVESMPDYKLQQSGDSGWDNPFRPDGELSREADEIVKLISGGKTITPTGNLDMENGLTNKDNNLYDAALSENITKTNILSTNTAKDRLQENNQKPLAEHEAIKTLDNRNVAPVQISNQVLPEPISASHVVIGEKKKKKGCCIIQ